MREKPRSLPRISKPGIGLSSRRSRCGPHRRSCRVDLAAPLRPTGSRLRRSLRLGGTFALGTTSCALWMSFGFMILISQFLAYRTFAWFNPALFVLPWVKFIPSSLQ